ncbi:hypothetical protein G2W53_013157 [Senna tora]|uniref:Uncharacterized protein n=1 Tax=Senna tora TaxID=362788 RepID=A0A834WSQ0_9FABA|nr:hypothetical protein G2W53_013157 [Senna tora]
MGLVDERLGARKLVREGENSSVIVTRLKKRLRLYLRELRAESLLRVLRHAQPLPRALKLPLHLLLPLLPLLHLPLQLLVPLLQLPRRRRRRFVMLRLAYFLLAVFTIVVAAHDSDHRR